MRRFRRWATVRSIRFWQSLNVSLMPPGYTGHYVWFWCRDYGDVVIWIGRVWISWAWGHKWPRANRMEWKRAT